MPGHSLTFTRLHADQATTMDSVYVDPLTRQVRRGRTLHPRGLSSAPAVVMQVLLTREAAFVTEEVFLEPAAGQVLLGQWRELHLALEDERSSLRDVLPGRFSTRSLSEADTLVRAFRAAAVPSPALERMGAPAGALSGGTAHLRP